MCLCRGWILMARNTVQGEGNLFCKRQIHWDCWKKIYIYKSFILIVPDMHSRNEYRKQCLKFFCTQHFQLVDSFFLLPCIFCSFCIPPRCKFYFYIDYHRICTQYLYCVPQLDFHRRLWTKLPCKPFWKKKKKEEKNPIFQAKSTTENDTFFIFEDKIASFKKSLKLHR